MNSSEIAPKFGEPGHLTRKGIDDWRKWLKAMTASKAPHVWDRTQEFKHWPDDQKVYPNRWAEPEVAQEENQIEVELTPQHFREKMLALAESALLINETTNQDWSEAEKRLDAILNQGREQVIEMELLGLKQMAKQVGLDITAELQTYELWIRNTARAASSHIENLLPLKNQGLPTSQIKGEFNRFTKAEVIAAYSAHQSYEMSVITINNQNKLPDYLVSVLPTGLKFTGNVYGNEVDLTVGPETMVIEPDKDGARRWVAREGNKMVAINQAGIEAAKGVLQLSELFGLKKSEVRDFFKRITTEMIEVFLKGESLDEDPTKNIAYKKLMLSVISQAHTGWSSHQLARVLFEHSDTMGDLKPANGGYNEKKANADEKLKKRLQSGDFTMISKIEDENAQSHAQVLLKDFYQIRQALGSFDLE